MWTVNAVASGIADEIRACAGNARVRGSRVKTEGYALRSDLRSRLGKGEGIRVEVTQENAARIAFEIVIHGIDPGNTIWNGKCVRAGILHAQRVSSDEGSRGNPTIHLENAAQ